MAIPAPSFHIQNSPNRWPDAVAKLPGGINKLLFGVERGRESKAVNPNVAVSYRWVGYQPLPHENFEQHCVDWLAQFVDGTFRREAEHIDYVYGYNETLANSQGPEERARWIALHTAMAKVWEGTYRQEEALQHIRILLCATAIGNDIPWEIAQAAQTYDAVLDYHPYVVCRVGKVNPVKERTNLDISLTIKHDAPRAAFHDWSLYKDSYTRVAANLYNHQTEELLYKMQESLVDSYGAMSMTRDPNIALVIAPDYVSPHDWRWYSGRWATMDAEYKARGITVDWTFGEGGPVLDASEDWSGWLDPLGGWKNPDCLNGDIEKYKAVMEYWLDNAVQTPAYLEGRLLGLNLFTSGAPGGSGGQWANFDLVQPDMNTIADLSAAYDYPPQVPVDPPDPPDPPVDCGDGKTRLQYHRRYLVVPQNATIEQWLSVCEMAYTHKQTVGFSYDDAGIGALDEKEAILYNIPNQQEFLDWFALHYPCTVVEFRDWPGDYQIVDVVEALPTHATKVYETRDTDDIHTLIIHHTTGGAFDSTEDIAKYHVNGKGWPGIGYHYLIDGAGGIEQTNYHETISYHASYANDDSIGISLKGSFVGDAMPSDDQIAATAWLVDRLTGEYAIDKVIGHKDTDHAQTPDGATRCPGDTWLEWKDRVA